MSYDHKHSILEAFYGFIFQSQSARKFLEEIDQFFAKNEKAETSNLLTKLILMKYKDRGNIKEYIMNMSNIAAKLKSLKLELGEDLIVYLLLISLSTHFGQFKVSYNTQKDKWSLNELISHCVQEEESFSKLKLNFNLERKLKLSNLIVMVNTMVDMTDQENNVQGLLSFFSKSVELFRNTSCQTNLAWTMSLWGKALKTTTYILNRVPTKVVNKTLINFGLEKSQASNTCTFEAVQLKHDLIGRMKENWTQE
ncbi:hypothetical protein CR513_53730, partial [Mucuna pruriens]